MFNYHVKTPNFSYTLQVKEKHSPFHTIEFLVGTNDQPCLEASLFLLDNDDALKSILNICTLHKIDAIEKCALEFKEDKSFGTELLYSFINIIKSNFPHITIIKLSDASYIPCNRKDDTLDLLTYSIAIHGKTWYELKSGAYLPTVQQNELYKNTVSKFTDPKTKLNIPFNEILSHMVSTGFTREYIGDDIQMYEYLYNSANTLPEFFSMLSKKIPKTLRCKFFKGWLEYFVGLHVFIGRDWLIDIKNNTLLNALGVLNVTKKRPMRRKSHNTYKKRRKPSNLNLDFKGVSSNS
jgi:hypothetical protein